VKRATVIGSGPNGLTAAIVLAKAGVEVTVLEAQPVIGGGTRSAELTRPGFIHDMCSAVHPLGIASPIFSTFPLKEHGLEWIQPDAPLAHPFEDGTAAVLEKSLEKTAARLGGDGPAYQHAVQSLVTRWNDLLPDILAPLQFPRHPFLFARFGMLAPWPATWVARTLFRQRDARALLAGAAAHSLIPLEYWCSSAVAWVLMISAHSGGWPIPRGGSQQIANALASYLKSLGGKIETSRPVTSLDELSHSDAILCDLTPRQLLKIAGHQLPSGYRQKLEAYRYGPGVFKMDWALNGPIPWTSPDCARAGTVHLGGSLEAIAASERAPWENRHEDRPFVLLAQPSVFDSTRAPVGQHTVWAYCHVPQGSNMDREEVIESQIERVAPGFRSRILARHAMGTADLEKHNANLIGGDISGGAQDLAQLFLRPTRHLYRTPRQGLYLCSSSTPPGAGVHGMCGYHAATAALKDAR
jgi:phytoene dehydrogenase-like protein